MLISKSDFINLCKSMGKDPEFEKLRAEVLSILKKQAKAESNGKDIHKSLEEMDKSFKYFDKDEFIIKSGYPVGTIREWKGRKYIKVAPNKWKPKYDSESKGAKNSITRLMKQVENCKNVEELMNLVMENKQRFTDANGNHLPIVDKLRAAADKKNDALSSGSENKVGSKKESPKAEEKKEKMKANMKKLDKLSKEGKTEFNDKEFQDIKNENQKIYETLSDPEKKEMLEHLANMKTNAKEQEKIENLIDNAIKQIVYDDKKISSMSNKRLETEIEKLKNTYGKERTESQVREDLKPILSNNAYDDPVAAYGSFVGRDIANRRNLKQLESELEKRNSSIDVKNYDPSDDFTDQEFQEDATKKDIIDGLNSEIRNYERHKNLNKKDPEVYQKYVDRIQHKKDLIEAVNNSDELANKILNYGKGLANESEAEKHKNRSDAMMGNENAEKDGKYNPKTSEEWDSAKNLNKRLEDAGKIDSLLNDKKTEIKKEVGKINLDNVKDPYSAIKKVSDIYKKHIGNNEPESLKEIKELRKKEILEKHGNIKEQAEKEVKNLTDEQLKSFKEKWSSIPSVDDYINSKNLNEYCKGGYLRTLDVSESDMDMIAKKELALPVLEAEIERRNKGSEKSESQTAAKDVKSMSDDELETEHKKVVKDIDDITKENESIYDKNSGWNRGLSSEDEKPGSDYQKWLKNGQKLRELKTKENDLFFERKNRNNKDTKEPDSNWIKNGNDIPDEKATTTWKRDRKRKQKDVENFLGVKKGLFEEDEETDIAETVRRVLSEII